MSEILAIVVLGAALIFGEMLFRRYSNAGALVYNLSGTIGGVLWVLAAVFLAVGGSYLLALVIGVIGVNIHRSNYRKVKKESSLRGSLNG